MSKPIVISDPFPRTLDLIFTKKKLIELKTKYKVLVAPDKKKRQFYENYIDKATFIMGQPDLDKKILSKAKKLKAIILKNQHLDRNHLLIFLNHNNE